MSSTNFYEYQWTLLDKTQAIVTPININNGLPTDAEMGNLNPYRASSSVTSSGIKKTRAAKLVLRCPNNLFTKIGPILTDQNAKTNYLIQCQFSQPNGSGGTILGDLFRFEIGKPSIDINNYAVNLTIPLTCIEVRAKESYDAQQLDLVTPQAAFITRVTNYYIHAGADLTPTPPLIFVGNDSDIALPNSPALTQSFLPSEPTPTKDLLDQQIQTLASPPPSGGVLGDYYYYFVIDPNATKTVRVFAELFGARSSGVTMDVLNSPATAAQQDLAIQTDNTSYKNLIIVRGQNGSHSWPMDYTRFASDYEHALFSAAYDSTIQYLQGQYAQYNSQLYKCIQTLPDTGPYEPPNVDTAHWYNLSTDTAHSPITNNYVNWLANIAGLTLQIPEIPADPYPNPPSVSDSSPAGYWGCMCDMNITRANYDPSSVGDSYYNTISMKAVAYAVVRSVNNEDIPITTPSNIPSDELLHGLRVIVSSSAVATDWPGTSGTIANCLLEYDTLSSDTPIWHASNAPVTNDSVTVWDTAQVMIWNGTSWITQWQLDNAHAGIASPFHPVANILNVNGKEGNLTATEFQFDFDVTANPQNAASRWVGFNFWFPWPRHDVTPIGDSPVIVGGIYANPFFDWRNFNLDPTGANIGYNNGTATENFGAARGIAMDLRLTFKNSNNVLVNGIYDIPIIIWLVDLFDRIVYTKAKVPRNGEWNTVQVQAGDSATNWQLYDNRIDELTTILGYTFPFNYYFKEREYTGVRFDWTKVRGGGVFWQDAYDENFFYKNAENALFDTIAQNAQQVASNLLYVVSAGFLDQGQYVISKGWCAVDNFRILKDAYVSSESTTVADSRQLLVYADDQYDYVNLKAIATSNKARKEFFPQFQVLNGYGDVRMTLGETFVAQGSRIPNSPATLVCAEVTFTEDQNGFRMSVIGVNRFIAP